MRTFSQSIRIYKRLTWVGALMLIAGVFVYLMTGNFGLFLILSAGALVVLLYSRRYLRCPHCEVFIPIMYIKDPAYCPSCGRKLDPE